jgi:hypothetical protein
MAELDDSFFRARTGRTTNPERAYLRAMAELGQGPVRSAEVAALLGKKVTALGPTRDGLIKKALCYSPRWGEIDFTVPMFGGARHRLAQHLGARLISRLPVQVIPFPSLVSIPLVVLFFQMLWRDPKS